MVTKRVGIAACCVLVATLFAVPSASGDVPRMGEQRVGLGCALVGTGFCADITLAANEPFHVAHGAAGEPIADLLNPVHRFELSIDGKQVHGAIDFDLDLQTGIGTKFYVFNFPRGMTGTHTFTGCWYNTDGSLFTCGTRVAHFE